MKVPLQASLQPISRQSSRDEPRVELAGLDSNSHLVGYAGRTGTMIEKYTHTSSVDSVKDKVMSAVSSPTLFMIKRSRSKFQSCALTLQGLPNIQKHGSASRTSNTMNQEVKRLTSNQRIA